MAMADGATVINLMWEAPTNMGASDITGYVIEYSKDVMLPWMDVATTTVTTGDDGTSYSDTGLAPETERHYRVSAVNILGRGPVLLPTLPWRPLHWPGCRRRRWA